MLKDIVCLTYFSIAENPEGEPIGDLSLGEADRPNPVYSKLAIPSTSMNPILDIIYVKTSSLYNVKLPQYYHFITNKEDKTINIAPKTEKDYYVFVAISKTPTILNVSLVPLEITTTKPSNYGLSDVSSKTSSETKTENKTIQDTQ